MIQKEKWCHLRTSTITMFDSPSPLNRDELQRQADAIPYWHHSIDLGQGVTSRGHKTPAILEGELSMLRLPSLEGRTVLDIGAWDGFFSFEAERRGAQRVVALDHFVWSIDRTKTGEATNAILRQGLPVPPVEQVPGVWDPVGLPGKQGFDLASKSLASRVETEVADFMEMDLAPLGQFDVVFYMGVLYHMRHPLLALERVFQVTKEVAIIETEAIHIKGQNDVAVCEFYETAELANDPTNWWAPTRRALEKMCRAAGFVHVDLLTPPVVDPALKVGHYRLHAHAWRTLEAREKHAHLYEGLVHPTPAEEIPPIAVPSAPATPPPPSVTVESIPWPELKGAAEQLNATTLTGSSSERLRWTRFITKPLRAEQGRINKLTAKLFKRILKHLRGNLEKRLSNCEQRLEHLERTRPHRQDGS